MDIEEAAQWYRRSGHQVTIRPLLGPDDERFRPDLLIERAGRKGAIMLSASAPAGPDLDSWSMSASQLGLPLTVVAPADASLAEACEAIGLEFKPLESFTEEGFLSRFSRQPPAGGLVPSVFPTLEPTGGPQETPQKASRIRRWALVGLIWAVAAMMVAWFLSRAVG
jgi:hypothetical protein